MKRTAYKILNDLYTFLYGDEDKEVVDPKDAIRRVEASGVDLNELKEFSNRESELALKQLTEGNQ